MIFHISGLMICEHKNHLFGSVQGMLPWQAAAYRKHTGGIRKVCRERGSNICGEGFESIKNINVRKLYVIFIVSY